MWEAHCGCCLNDITIGTHSLTPYLNILQDMLYELNRVFATSDEGFTELNLNLNLVKKYPVHCRERVMWRKLNGRSSLQCFGEIVANDSFYRDDDLSYRVRDVLSVCVIVILSLVAHL